MEDGKVTATEAGITVSINEWGDTTITVEANGSTASVVIPGHKASAFQRAWAKAALLAAAKWLTKDEPSEG